MTQSEKVGVVSLQSDDLENEEGALGPCETPHSKRFVILDRTNGSRVACQVSSIDFLAEGDSGSILHFTGSSQVNVNQDLDEVLALVNS